jgi:chemosensory pili system protein ChpA (sensor histidine kinase/response regulator)
VQGFSIDDVRDTISTDMTRFIDRIERAAATLEDPHVLRDAGEAPAFQVIGDSGHAMYGTSALVGAESLANTASMIQHLAEDGKHELALAIKHYTRARELALAASSGAGEMRTMLGLELDHQRDDALWIAREWQKQADDLLARLTDFPPQPARQTPAADPGAIDGDPIMAELREVFQQEAREISGSAKIELATLTEDPTDIVALRSLERLYHTLKGAAATVGMSAVADAATALQQSLQAVVDDGAPGSAELVQQLIARSTDLFAEAGLFAEPEVRHVVPKVPAELWDVFEEECTEILEKLETELLGLEESAEPRARLAGILPHYHTLKGVVNTVNLGPIGQLLHRVEDLLEYLVEGTGRFPAARVATVLLKIQAEVQRSLEQAKQGYVDPPPSSLEEELTLLAGTEEEPRGSAAEDFAAHELSQIREDREEPEEKVASRRFVRVRTDRLDGLMNLAGELVVSRSRLMARVTHLRSQHHALGAGGKKLVERLQTFSAEHESTRLGQLAIAEPEQAEMSNGALFGELELDRYEEVHVLSRQIAALSGEFSDLWKTFSATFEALTDDSDVFGKIVAGIRSEVTHARMVPLEVLSSQLKLTARDVGLREKKPVRFAMRGGEVHLDKTIAEGLLSPLLHLVRNAVGHGIEAAELRERLGKPRTGVVELSAREERGQIILELRDDGGGLDLALLREKGVAARLVSENVPLDDPAIRDLIFVPGLSTEDHARAVAGRGLGCDFVRRSVEKMNGNIRVETEAGRGTTFFITLPLTLAITRALLVEHAGQSFAVPLYFAERIIDPLEHELVEDAGVLRVRIDRAWMPVVAMSSVLGSDRESSRTGPLVVVRMGDERLVLQVDAVLNQEEVVVKSLGTLLTGHPVFSGVTMRGTGELVLILDVPSVIGAHQAEGRRPASLSFVEIEHDTLDIAGAETQKLRVLFVDDSLSVRKVAEKMLASLDADVTLAVDGVDALAKLDAQSFDLVFTDLEMPRMHGFELIAQLRAREDSRTVPIVVVTSRAATKHRDHAAALGANEYLTKPFSEPAIRSALEKWGRSP